MCPAGFSARRMSPKPAATGAFMTCRQPMDTRPPWLPRSRRCRFTCGGLNRLICEKREDTFEAGHRVRPGAFRLKNRTKLLTGGLSQESVLQQFRRELLHTKNEIDFVAHQAV